MHIWYVLEQKGLCKLFHGCSWKLYWAQQQQQKHFFHWDSRFGVNRKRRAKLNWLMCSSPVIYYYVNGENMSGFFFLTTWKKETENWIKNVITWSDLAPFPLSYSCCVGQTLHITALLISTFVWVNSWPPRVAQLGHICFMSLKDDVTTFQREILYSTFIKTIFKTE